ncbi:ABC transporter family protein [Tritrichomonas foetus]|uniref:ABC transporter family protein n=1 Tax=Tritrichomonas foetus TaxID=1144522 RepID=A0A1J4L203_9EUKA|nr:ABC transporter family protein [Tritrichomonas foetus]|eukprot:OHT17475.1 ABC transporter family protein [Tritrichomonas foetus]
MKKDAESNLFNIAKMRPMDLFRVCGYAFSPLSSTLFLLLLIFSGVETYLGNIIGTQPSKIYGYISSRDNKSFGNCLLYYFLWLSLICVHISIKLWISDRLSIILRDKLVKKIHEKYFAQNAFFDLLLFSAHIDNPDARIASDCTNWAQTICLIAIQLTMMPIYVVWYGIKTFQMMGGYAVLICLCFAILSVFFSWLVMSPIVKLTYSFEAANGDYRLQNVLIKDNSEIIALSQGQQKEKEMLDLRLIQALDIQKGLANYSILMNVLTNIFNYFGNGLIYICIYACQPDGLDEDGIASFISLVSFVTIEFIYGLTMIVLVMQNIAKLTGYSTRIHELWTVLLEHKSKIHSIETGNKIEMKNVTVTKPNGEVLIRNLSFLITPSHALLSSDSLTQSDSLDNSDSIKHLDSLGNPDSLMIAGPSGCGKSSILRTLGKIWPAAEGDMILPVKSPNSLLVLPQKPYLPYGSLYDCCAFPLTANEIDKDKILAGLNFFNLTHLISRSEDWQLGLSPGEKQRIALIRVFVHHPQFLILDEATSAISQQLELKFYEKIKEMNIAVLSVAHHQYLKKYHNQYLEINNDGTYTLTKL